MPARRLITGIAAAPIRIGDWRDIGLGSWSGGVAYSRRLAGGNDRTLLDLGRVRGSVRVNVDGRTVGEAFCQPYRFDLTGLLDPAGSEVEVTVFNTLAPYLEQASPTPWTFPSQLHSGLLGPVSLHRQPIP